MKTSVWLKVILVAALLALTANSVQAQTNLSHFRGATRLRATDHVIGRLPARHLMHVVIALKLSHPAALHAFLANPHHPLLTSMQFTDQYGPTVTQAQAVVDFMRHAGFRDITVASNRLLVSGYASAGIVGRAFHTSFVQVRTRHGRRAYANNRDVYLPAALKGIVTAVLGLQNVYQFHTGAIRFNGVQPDRSGGTGGSGTAEGHDPTDFPIIYGANALPAAVSVPVAIITEGSMTNVESDLTAFTTANSLPTVTVTVVPEGSGSTDTSGDAEWDLDSQDIVAMGGVQALTLYDASSMNFSDLTPDFNNAVTADAVKVINASLGACETSAQQGGVISAEDPIFEQADAQGQTFSFSAGDSGADECSNHTTTPSYPASSPYVVALGGTELYTTGNTTWASETVWNDQALGSGATGGSPSTVEPMPAWQQGVGQNTGSSFRGVPDIAFDASPYSGALIIVDGQPNQQYGGTSLASPLFVGTWARMLQNYGTNLGFAAPLIYAAASANYANDFTDIVTGNNITTGDTVGYTAAPGWDYTTGFGSLIVNQIVNDIHPSSNGNGNITPVANNGSVSTNENNSASGMLSATDSDGDSLSFSITAVPSHGTASFNNSATGYFTYTPISSFAGSDSFSFDVTDSAGNVSNTATESVTVNPIGTGSTFNNTTSAPINDNATVSSQISVSGESGNAPVDLEVSVNITHNWSGDLELDLLAPNGRVFVLKAPDYNNEGSINTTYTVNASAVAANGVWTLQVIDHDPDYLGDFGTLNSWSLTFP